jgi:hypothetical protein
MTATNHAITGAVIAVAVTQPILAILLAFGAHFAMDAIPHFGIPAKDVFERNNNRSFRLVLIADCLAAAILLLLIPYLLRNQYDWWLVFLCMFACMSPDLVWGARFYHELKTKTQKLKSRFSRFHSHIQWSETYQGAFVELVWFLAAALLIFSSYHYS